MTSRRRRTAGRGESPTEKFLRLEKSGAPVVKVNVGGITPNRSAPPEEPAPDSSEAASPEVIGGEPDADGD
jgi:hypothetical protein